MVWLIACDLLRASHVVWFTAWDWLRAGHVVWFTAWNWLRAGHVVWFTRVQVTDPSTYDISSRKIACLRATLTSCFMKEYTVYLPVITGAYQQLYWIYQVVCRANHSSPSLLHRFKWGAYMSCSDESRIVFNQSLIRAFRSSQGLCLIGHLFSRAVQTWCGWSYVLYSSQIFPDKLIKCMINIIDSTWLH